MSDDNEEKSLVIKKVIFAKKKLDKEIGYNYWKRYIASVFWSQISTPINLTITMLTAITTAQINTNNLLSSSVSSNLAIVSLILATLNTFFRPHTQYATNTELLSKWTSIGIKFEEEYYNNRVEGKAVADYRKRLESLHAIQKEVTDLRQAEGTNTINFLTDLIFFISYNTCLNNSKNWLDRDKSVEEAVKHKLDENANKKSNKKSTNKKTSEIKAEENEIIQPSETAEVKVDVKS